MSEAIIETFEASGANFEIGPPTSEDAVTIGLMHLQSWIETYQNPEVGVDEQWIREHMSHVAESSGDRNGRDFRLDIFEKIEQGEPIFYRVAKDEHGEVVGFVVANKTEDPELPNTLDALYTLKRVQGLGLGGKLMHEAMTWLGQEKDISLEVVAYNGQARSFYDHYGFSVKPETKHIWKNPVEVVEMVRQFK